MRGNIKNNCGSGNFDMDLWWEERSLPGKIIAGIGFAILAVGFFALLGLAVMALWNWLMPEIFGLKKLTYWQAFGLFALSKILFQGIRFHDENKSAEKKRKKELRKYMQQDLEEVRENGSSEFKDMPDPNGPGDI